MRKHRLYVIRKNVDCHCHISIQFRRDTVTGEYSVSMYGLYDAGTAGGVSAQQGHDAGFLKHAWNQIATGETDGGNQTEQPSVAQRIFLIKNMVAIDVGPIAGDTHRAGHGVLHADRAHTQEPCDEKLRGVGITSAITTQVDDNILDGAVLAGDLLVRIHDQADGVPQFHGVFRLIVQV